MKLEFPEVAKFEITVDEIAQTARLILANTKRTKVRAAIKTMIDELRKGNEKLVKEVLAPLCSVKTKEDFDKKFGEIHERFKEQYLGSRTVLLTINCDLVTQQIDALIRSRQWTRNFGLDRAVTRLEMIGQEWIANDAVLADSDRKMLTAVNKFVDGIAKVKSKAARYKEYVDGVKPLEERYVAIRDQMAELETLSAKL